jgi:CheY-like chemotaxis protein
MAKKILLIDDEEDIRGLLKELLTAEGYEVKEASNGKDGLSLMKKQKFDLVVIDFFMPGMSGREVAENRKKDPSIKGTKFMFLTVAEFGAKGQEELKKLGAKAYMKKPMDNDEFISQVNKLVK